MASKQQPKRWKVRLSLRVQGPNADDNPFRVFDADDLSDKLKQDIADALKQIMEGTFAHCADLAGPPPINKGELLKKIHKAQAAKGEPE